MKTIKLVMIGGLLLAATIINGKILLAGNKNLTLFDVSISNANDGESSGGAKEGPAVTTTVYGESTETATQVCTPYTSTTTCPRVSGSCTSGTTSGTFCITKG